MSTTQEGRMKVVGVDEEIDPLLDALSSDTAREVLEEIYAEPGTPSEIADRLDMSIQNVSYHLDNLAEEDLISVAGTRYSEKGQEMKIYRPPEEPVVLFVGTRERKDALRTLVSRLLPMFGILALASVAIQRLFGPGGAPFLGGDSGGGAVEPQSTTETEAPTGDSGAMSGGGDGGTATPATTPEGPSIALEGAEATPTPTPEPTPMAETAVRATESAPGGLDLALSPGLVFFLGGLLVLGVWVAWWAYRAKTQNVI